MCGSNMGDGEKGESWGLFVHRTGVKNIADKPALLSPWLPVLPGIFFSDMVNNVNTYHMGRAGSADYGLKRNQKQTDATGRSRHVRGKPEYQRIDSLEEYGRAVFPCLAADWFKDNPCKFSQYRAYEWQWYSRTCFHRNWNISKKKLTSLRSIRFHISIAINRLSFIISILPTQQYGCSGIVSVKAI